MRSVRSGITTFSEHAFTESVNRDIISPTVDDILLKGNTGVISFGFLLSLWAGSSAVSCFVDSIVDAHGQDKLRHPIRQRLFALILYIAFLVIAVVAVPLIALGPRFLLDHAPKSWDPSILWFIQYCYLPTVFLLVLFGLTILYRAALPQPLPWHRLFPGTLLAGLFFWIASSILRKYLEIVTSHGYSYGALAAPIAYLLFTFFVGFALVLGAEFNAVIQEFWPANPTHSLQIRVRLTKLYGNWILKIRRRINL